MIDTEFVQYGSGPLTGIENGKYIIYLFWKISHTKYASLQFWGEWPANDDIKTGNISKTIFK